MSDRELLEFELADGIPVYVETTDTGTDAGLRRVDRGLGGFGSFPRSSVGMPLWPLQRPRFHDAGASRSLLRRDKFAPTLERL